ncbi:hypothetical protein Q31b_38320 [Novipirellula aureliae]|uniref:DUF423 domain-containing protein n=1 Tax=Novipirellula aureliae TaxID=2527966 RepID=A0A5C6DRD3_9BACT|nr:DUF423 domain-containing protein [Novipirellula aureliae]TWU38754.1 hypothetical protein Q31b_38320 [Novipirellula aureliae]
MKATDASQRKILVLAAVCGALGVLIGAFGAHGLPNLLADRGLPEATVLKRLDQFDVGARYHLIHAVVLLALAALPIGSHVLRTRIAWMFVAGILFFSGSLYLLVLTNQPKFGAITPIGGATWIAAWLLLVRLR